MPGVHRVRGAWPKLALACGVIVSATIYLASLGATADWQYYLTTDECLEQAETLIGDRLRVSGKIEAGTLRIAPDRRSATFKLAGKAGDLVVTSSCFVPDNLAEEREVVVEGQLETPQRLQAHQLITRCASKYESRPAAETMANSPESARPRR